jgi:Asp-tRNA(Asn)/Glu-tRNA(Gln) amidotransferase A subunit family amidase
MSADLIEAGVVAIADAIMAGEITSESITQTSLARLDTRGRRFNGVVMIEAERALDAARGARHRRRRRRALGGGGRARADGRFKTAFDLP